MKKLHLTLLVLALVTSITLQAQDYRFNAKPNGFSVSNRSNTTINIHYNVNAITIEDSNLEQVDGQMVTMSGIFLPNQAGAPDLPSSSTCLAIPNGAQPSIQMVSSKTKVIENVDLVPAPQPHLDSDNSKAVYEKDMDIYSRNAFYPATPYNISEVMTVRGVEMVQVGVMPFQYNPVTKELVVYEDLELQVSYEGGNGTYGDIRYRTPKWDQILQDMLLNRDMLPEVDYGELLRKHYENRETGCLYMIITPDNEGFISLADSIKQFRTNQGIPTEVFTVSDCGGNDQTSIRNFIRNAYNTWDMAPEAVLLLGDHNTDGTQGIVSYSMNNHPGGDGYNPYISDNKYADMNNDHLPDIALGRITGRNYDEMYHMIKKDLDFERTPPTNPDFYDKPVTAMGFQLERWFQLCSEVVNGFWQYELGKHPVRINAIYEGTPGSRWSSADHTNSVVNYFGPNGCGYIPQNMSHLTDWDGTGNQINEAINSGAFLVQHRDHGSEELWGEPRYSISTIRQLTNNDLTYVMSNNCLTGRFNYGGANSEGCFAEVFHRHQHGALGLIAATQVSYSFVNDVYVWGMYDNLWPDFMPTYGTWHENNFLLPAFGNVAGKYYLNQSNWTSDYVKEITYYLFHHHGDTYMNLYSEMPQQLDVEMLPVIPAGSNQYQLKVDEGATICLTANGQIIGFANGTGNMQTITVTPQEVGTRVLLTITKQNYYRYEHELAIIPNNEPYLIFNTLEFNDEEGNNNQTPDFNETCQLNIGINNVGFANIDNVHATLTCQHPEVQIIENGTDYGTINTGDTPMVNNAFTVHFNESINDGETVRFFLQLENDSYRFNDSIDVKINAPTLNITNVSLSNLNGEPTDRFFRGETTVMTFDITNSGHSKSLELNNILDIHAPFLDIDDSSKTINAIEAGETSQVTFHVSIHNDAPKGNILNYSVETLSGVRTIHYENRTSLGYTTEDFEDNELNPNLQWSLGSGNKKWYIIEDPTATEGYCLRSPSINNNNSARLVIGVDCSIPETFSFYHKTSTEAGDKLQLVINSIEIDSWSGETDWEMSTFELREGQNLISLEYRKDAQGSGGEDCVMVDHLLFPPKESLFIFAGDDAEICDNAFMPNSCVLYADEINWTTNGDGFFDNTHLEQPTYTFGSNDIQNGQVVLNVSASSNNSQLNDEITAVLIENLSEITPELPIGENLIDLRITEQSTYSAFLNQSYDYNWNLEPEEAGSINAERNEVTVNWNSDYRGNANLSYSIANSCSQSNASVFDIRVINTTSIDETNSATVKVYPNPATGILNIMANDIQSSQVVIRLIDHLGRTVFMSVRSSNDNSLEEQIGISNLPSGLYDLQIIDGNHTLNSRVIIR